MAIAKNIKIVQIQQIHQAAYTIAKSSTLETDAKIFNACERARMQRNVCKYKPKKEQWWRSNQHIDRPT